MRLIIAEKPSLARAIADAHDGSFKRHEGYLENRDTCISWCFGHLLEQAPPDAYNPAYKRWTLEDLPIVPEQWKLVPRPKSRAQLKILKTLLASADLVIHAGDPDREGQLLVQEVLEQLGWKGPVQRLLVNDMNRSAVRQALTSLRDNREFQALYRAAESRARADWLYGINLSRAWTLTGQHAGHQGVLSIGRVQTPVLGLVARRDQAIEEFEPVPFYSLWADFTTQNGTTRGWWQPDHQEALKASGKMDEQGRLLDKSMVETMAAAMSRASASVESVTRTKKRQRAPLPYSLSTLQIDAARRYRLSAKQVLDAVQSLYERHQLVTYPRSDCRYLPTTYLNTIDKTLKQATQGNETLTDWYQGGDSQRRGPAFNDSRINAHHAIVPTGRRPDWQRLNGTESNVYRLVCRNLLAQFYPDHEFNEVKARFTVVTCDGSPVDKAFFDARGREIIVTGWKSLFSVRGESPPLPPLHQGETAAIEGHDIDHRMTQPPPWFNDASLLNAMTHIGRYVEDPAVKQTLRDTDGLGTEATRASIIETLIGRGLIVRTQGHLRATQPGRALVAALPEDATRPERTARWEQTLDLIEEGSSNVREFLDDLLKELRQLLVQADVERMRQALAMGATIDAPKAPASAQGRNKKSSRTNGQRQRRSRTTKGGTTPQRRRAAKQAPRKT